MPKDYKQEAQEKAREVGSYLKRMRRYQPRIAETHDAMGDLSQELAHLLELYGKKQINDKEFVDGLRPYGKQLRSLEKSTRKDEKIVKRERQTIEDLLERFAAVILLAIATFSLVTSILDNPSITGFAVLGISQATNATFILNLLAFVFVLLLVYPSGDIILPIKATKVRKSRKAIRKKRK